MKNVLTLAFADFKIIFRDASLRTFLLLPLLLFVLMIWAVPPLIETYDFLTPYASLFLIVAVIENTQMFCFISTMVLIDEKETDVAKVYGVVPLTKLEYLLSRFLFPCLFTVLLNVVMFAVQPLFDTPFSTALLLSCLTALVVPVYVMAINAIVQNRMQGMVYIKAFNMLVLVPIAAFFVPEGWQHVFGVFPTHWVFQGIENVTLGETFWPEAAIGGFMLIVMMWMIGRTFMRRHFV